MKDELTVAQLGCLTLVVSMDNGWPKNKRGSIDKSPVTWTSGDLVQRKRTLIGTTGSKGNLKHKGKRAVAASYLP